MWLRPVRALAFRNLVGLLRCVCRVDAVDFICLVWLSGVVYFDCLVGRVRLLWVVGILRGWLVLFGFYVEFCVLCLSRAVVSVCLLWRLQRSHRGNRSDFWSLLLLCEIFNIFNDCCIFSSVCFQVWLVCDLSSLVWLDIEVYVF